MKIAYVNQTYPPMVTGVSHMLRQLARGMADRGHTVLLIVASDLGKAYVITAPGLTIVRLRSFRTPMAARQRFMFWPRREIETILKAFSPDIVHFHDPLLAGLIRVRPGRQKSTAKVMTAHIHPGVLRLHVWQVSAMKDLAEKGSIAAANWAFRRCDAVVSPTRTIAGYFSRIGIHSVEVISNGIDLERFSPRKISPDEGHELRKKYGLHPDHPVILHVGRLSKEKNLHGLLRAAALAMHEVDVQLVIAGDGPEREKLARLSEQLGIADRTFFPGFVYPDGDLPALYRLASVFITASEIEAQGLVLLEAAACGAPIVAVRAGAAPEVVIDGLNGWLVSPGDELGMAALVRKFLQDPVHAQSMGLKGRAIAEDHAQDKTIQAHERLYRRLVAVSSKPHQDAVVLQGPLGIHGRGF